MAYKPCEYLKVESKSRITKNDCFQCLIEIPQPKLPVSITESYDFKWPLNKKWVRKEDCSKCDFYKPIK